MIPPDWVDVTRPGDREVVGYLDLSGDEVVPLSLLGQPLGDPADFEEAERLVLDVGIGYLAEPWILTEDDGTERRVVVLELDRERAVVGHADFALVVGRPAELTERFEVPLPTDRMRRA